MAEKFQWYPAPDVLSIRIKKQLVYNIIWLYVQNDTVDQSLAKQKIKQGYVHVFDGHIMLHIVHVKRSTNVGITDQVLQTICKSYTRIWKRKTHKM